MTCSDVEPEGYVCSSEKNMKTLTDDMEHQPRTQQDTFLPPAGRRDRPPHQLKYYGEKPRAEACLGSQWGGQQGEPTSSFREASQGTLHCSWGLGKQTPHRDI